MKSKGYTVYSQQNQINIVGIRRQYEGDSYSNAFKDDLWVIYQNGTASTWQYKKYKISTMPGFFYGYDTIRNGQPYFSPDYSAPSNHTMPGVTSSINIKQSKMIVSRGGLGILMPAQYINLYQTGSFLGAPAMVTRPNPGKQKFYRDTSPGNTITYTTNGEGYVGMFLHRGYGSGGSGYTVDNFSEGCSVFSNKTDHDDMFNLANQHATLYGNIFTYTLLLASDIPNYGS